MAHVVADRVRETTTTTGTGTYTLAGAVTGFETFGSIGNTNTTYYCCTDGTNFEVGVGTYASSGTTLARTTILQSSNSDSAVNWSAGTRQIFCTLPAEKSVIEDASNNVAIAGVLTSTGLTIGSAAITEAELEILDGASVTTTELNIIDGDTSATSTTLADADRLVANDAGTMKQVALTDVKTYLTSAGFATDDPTALAIALG
jgi:hypothetical protein|tara:strand:- start:626 stop:1234 length:609 start_codon:yes stop_codon:yes gene_type:complete